MNGRYAIRVDHRPGDSEWQRRISCTWKDGDRLFVDVNGATIGARSLRVEQEFVTLQFQARVAPLETPARHGARGDILPIQNDPLHDECRR
jgi:hypothetical protein